MIIDAQVEAAAREIWGDDWPDYADAMRAALEAAAQAAPAVDAFDGPAGRFISATDEARTRFINEMRAAAQAGVSS